MVREWRVLDRVALGDQDNDDDGDGGPERFGELARLGITLVGRRWPAGQDKQEAQRLARAQLGSIWNELTRSKEDDGSVGLVGGWEVNKGEDGVARRSVANVANRSVAWRGES